MDDIGKGIGIALIAMVGIAVAYTVYIIQT
jgi:hypothetical protein